jgi:anti-anti-sigma factor
MANYLFGSESLRVLIPDPSVERLSFRCTQSVARCGRIPSHPRDARSTDARGSARAGSTGHDEKARNVLELTVEKLDDLDLLRFGGSLTLANTDGPIRDAVGELLHAGRRSFLFDLREVSFMDSASIGETVACTKRVREAGGVLKLLVEPGSEVERVLTLSALDRVMEIFRDRDEAVSSFSS